MWLQCEGPTRARPVARLPSPQHELTHQSQRSVPKGPGPRCVAPVLLPASRTTLAPLGPSFSRAAPESHGSPFAPEAATASTVPLYLLQHALLRHAEPLRFFLPGYTVLGQLLQQ